jgi:hypothetical protein
MSGSLIWKCITPGSGSTEVSLATVEEVRRRGGLNEETDHNLFRVADEAELDDMVAEDLALAEAWISERVSTEVYTGSATASTARDLIFARAECLMALHFLTLPLKARKVEGTHWAVDQEGSERFAELIDVEYLNQAKILIEQYVTVDIDTDEAPFALPAFAVIPATDRSVLTAWPEVLQEELDAATGAIGVYE